MEKYTKLRKIIGMVEEKRAKRYIKKIEKSDLSFKNELLERLNYNIDNNFFQIRREDRDPKNGFKELFNDGQELSFEDIEELKKIFGNHYSKRNDLVLGFFNGVIPDLLGIEEPHVYSLNVPMYSYLNFFHEAKETELCKITRKGKKIVKDFDSSWNIRLFSSMDRMCDHEFYIREMAILLKESDDDTLQEFIDMVQEKQKELNDLGEEMPVHLYKKATNTFLENYSTPDKLRKGLEELKGFRFSYIKINKDKEKEAEVLINAKDKPILDYINDTLFSDKILARYEDDKPINLLDELIDHTFVSLLYKFFDEEGFSIRRLMVPMIARKKMLTRVINKIDYKFPTLMESDYYTMYHLNVIMSLFTANHLFFGLLFRDDIEKEDGMLMQTVEGNYGSIASTVLKLITICTLYFSDNIFVPALDILPFAELMESIEEDFNDKDDKDPIQKGEISGEFLENLLSDILASGRLN